MASFQNFTEMAKQVIRAAQEIAVEQGHQSISHIHLFAALVYQEDGIVQALLNKLEVDPYVLHSQVIDLLETKASRIDIETEENPIIQLYPTPSFGMALQRASQIATSMNETYVGPEHLFLAILEKPDSLASIIQSNNISTDSVRKGIEELRVEEAPANIPVTKAKTLEKFGTNLTDLARKNALDPVIGREVETNRVIQILARRTKNNPLLIGEAGTGKTAIAEGLAQRIAAEDVPESMRTKEVYNLDLVAMLAGTKFRGEFEDRLKKVIEEIEAAGDKYIIFLDEIHTLMGTGGAEGTMDAANILKPTLARGKIRLIGATTLREFQKHIEKDGALTRRLQPVYITEPSIDDTIAILRGLREKYEVYHGVRITDEAIVAAAQLSSRYLTERFLPDKAIDLIDESASHLRVSLENKPEKLDVAQRQVRRLEIELEALKKDLKTSDDKKVLKDKIEKINKDIADIKDKNRSLELGWKNEKETIALLKEIKEKLEQKRHEGVQAESSADYGKAAEIRYNILPVLEKDLEKAERKLKRLQKNRQILKEEITAEEIATVISRWTGIPINKMLESESKRLVTMEKTLKEKVIGQDEAIEKVSAAIKRSRAGISNEKRPIGSFMFLGPTGVGKTELAKQLAEFMFDDQKALIRLDMSEYMEPHSVSKILGSPPGYIGHDESGFLTEQVRHRPYSIVLLDEIEKAHPDILNILLQLFDEGTLTDSKGRTVNFKNTIIILTSNLGSEQLIHMNDIGFADDVKKSEQVDKEYSVVRTKIMDVLEKTFRPELLNRFDEIVIFKPLTKKAIEKIVSKMLSEALVRLQDKKINVDVSKDIYTKIAKDGFDPKYGARPVERKIQTEILNPLANLIISGDIVEKNKISIELKDDKIFFKIPKKRVKKAITT